MTSIIEIAKKAGVSPMTVSNVINKKYSKVSQSTVGRVERIIEELNYVPNLSARSLVSSSSKIIVLVIPQTIKDDPHKDTAFQNPFYGELINSVEYRLRLEGYYLMLRFVDAEDNVSSMIVNWNADGVIVLGGLEQQVKSNFKDSKIPLVLIDSYVEEDEYHSINNDDIYGGMIGTEYLIAKGKRNIAVLSSPLGLGGISDKRFKGYQMALEKYNLLFVKEYVYEVFPSYEDGLEVAKEIVKKINEIDAVFAFSDMLAIGLIQGLKNEGIKIPEQVAVMGYDGLFVGELCEPKLTTIKQDIYEKGARAVEVLLDSINNEGLEKKNITLPVTLIERGTI